MKRVGAIVCALAVALGIVNSRALAAQEPDANWTVVSEITEYYEDGTFATVVIKEQPEMVRAVSTKTGSKTYSLKDSDGSVIWQFTEKGTFSVNKGVSATCTAASHTVKIVDTAWKNTEATSKKSGNQAIGDATFIKKLLGLITTDTKTCHVVLTCDKNGKLS